MKRDAVKCLISAKFKKSLKFHDVFPNEMASRYWEDCFLSGRSIPPEIKPVAIANAAK